MQSPLVIFALAAAVAAGAAWADSPKKSSAASAGSSAPSASATDQRSGIDIDAAFRKADIDGDSAVSKAEAAGNERLVTGFDRADRKPRDGKLSRAEFESIYHPKPLAKSKGKKKTAAASKGTASTGTSRATSR